MCDNSLSIVVTRAQVCERLNIKLGRDVVNGQYRYAVRLEREYSRFPYPPRTQRGILIKQVLL